MHLEIFGFPVGGAYGDIFVQFKTMHRKKNLASAQLVSKKNIRSNHTLLHILKLFTNSVD